MPATTLLDLPDDALYVLCEAASTVHPPHWEFPSLRNHGEEFEPDDDTAINMRGRTFCLGWVYLSHVCRRLRNICLDSPASWAKVIIAFPSSSSEAQNVPLARARDAPLNMNIPRFSHHSARYAYLYKVHFAQQHIHRARTVGTTDGGSEPALDWRPTFKNQTYPSLQILDIFQQPPSQIPIDAPNLHMFCGMDAIPLFSFSPTRLRDLDLNLRAVSGFGDGRRVEELVLDVLRTTPLLQGLSLKLEVVNFSAGELETTGPPIVLKHLEMGVMGASDTVDLGFIWSSLHIPERTYVDFTILGSCLNEPAIFHSVASQMRCQDYAQLLVTLKEEFEFNTLPHFQDMKGDKRSRRVKLTFRPKRGDIVGLEDKLEHVLVATNVEQIKYLHFAAGRPFDAVGFTPALFAFFSAFNTVGALTIATDEDTTWPIYFLLTCRAASLFPFLQAVMVRHDPLHEMDSIYGGSRSLVTAKAYWSAILGFLEARWEADRPILTLILDGTWPWQRPGGPKSWSALDARSIKLAKTYVGKLVDSRIVEEL